MKINDIIIKKRVRQDLGDLSALKDSLKKHGLLYPIIINANKELIAGERRLVAAKELDWEEIDVVIRDLSFTEALEMELKENTTRKEFNAYELRQGLEKYHYHKSSFFQKIIIFFKNLLFSKKK